ncbi:hypothetical protein [Algibacter aquimarinus]
MKKTFFYSLILMLSLSFMSFNCSNDNDELNNNSQQIAQIESVAKSGTWRITNFNDSGQDETADFAGYTFSFNNDGTLVATNGTNTVNGTWSITNDDSSDDDNSNDDIDFNISFPVPETNDFEDLNDDWDIVSASSTKIELIDISGGNGGTDMLTFEK